MRSGGSIRQEGADGKGWQRKYRYSRVEVCERYQAAQIYNSAGCSGTNISLGGEITLCCVI